jgi:nucleoid DNA-binding protein
MNSPLPVMDMNELVTEISAAEPERLAPETVRRCLNLLSELVGEEAQKGRRVEIEWFGTFSLSPTGQLAFAEDLDRA